MTPDREAAKQKAWKKVEPYGANEEDFTEGFAQGYDAGASASQARVEALLGLHPTAATMTETT